MVNKPKFDFLSLFYSCVITIWVISFSETSSASAFDGKTTEGIALYKNQKFNQARQKFYEAYLEKPNDPIVSYNLGNSHYKQGNYEKALKNYLRSMDQESSKSINQKSNYNIGNTLFRMNKFDESIKAYKKTLELNPNDMDAKFNLEFAREQVKKKQNQDKLKKHTNEKEKTTKSQKESPNKNKKLNFLPEKERKNPNLNQDKNTKKNSLPIKENSYKKMTKEEAEQKLNVLTEDLKMFQRKQALEMKSIFTYQGNDW
jgi:Ca-activated chloride channel homolog